jgi:hypothetical protein
MKQVTVAVLAASAKTPNRTFGFFATVREKGDVYVDS